MYKIKWQKWINPLINIDMNGLEGEEGHVIVKNTPFGLQPSRMSLSSIAKNRIYIGHTNFPLDADCVEVINNTSGVEGLEVETPYMFKVIIGKAFNKKAVRISIEKQLCHDESSITADQLVIINSELIKMREQDKPWAIYVLPNGRYESFIAKNDRELTKKLQQYENFVNVIGGTILCE